MMPEPKLWYKIHLWILTYQQKFWEIRNTDLLAWTCMTQDTDVYGETTKSFINFHCVHFKDQVSTIQPSVLIAGLTTIKKKLFAFHSNGWWTGDGKHTKSLIFLSKEWILFKSKLKILFHTWHLKLRNIGLVISFKNCDHKHNSNTINTYQYLKKREN